MATLCEDCTNSHSENAKRKPYRWMCVKFPRLDASNYVTSKERVSEPYMYCKDINGGHCPLYERNEECQI